VHVGRGIGHFVSLICYHNQAKTYDDKALEMINNTISHLAKSLKNIIDEAKT
jgi:hypothetical protein